MKVLFFLIFNIQSGRFEFVKIFDTVTLLLLKKIRSSSDIMEATGRVIKRKCFTLEIKQSVHRCFKNIFARLYSIWLFTTSVSKMVSSVYSLLTINSMVSNFWCSRTVSKVYSKLIDYYNNFYVDGS
jgi:hypothetical protein